MTRAARSRAWELVVLAAVVGLFVAAPLLRRSSAAEEVRTRLGELDRRLARLEEDAARPEAAHAAAPPQLAPASRPLLSPTAENPDASPPQAPASVSSPPGADVSDEETEALLDLLDAYLGQNASVAEQERLFATLRDGRTLPKILETLEERVAADPHDLDARMRLASAYVAKLFTVPAGPEMGVWSAKAEAQWQAVLDSDERHWEARFRLATNYAYYPDVMNKTGEAIRHLETLRRQQEESAPEPRQASVYTVLAALYRRQGEAARADAVLDAGHLRHPDTVTLPSTPEGR